jgi:hypothetical protein
MSRPEGINLDARFERVLDLAARRAAYGLGGGLLLAGLMLRGRGTRGVAVGLGVGLGLGSAYADSRQDLECFFGTPQLPKGDDPYPIK